MLCLLFPAMASHAGCEIMKSEVRGSILSHLTPMKRKRGTINTINTMNTINTINTMNTVCSGTGETNSLSKHPGRNDESNAIITY